MAGRDLAWLGAAWRGEAGTFSRNNTPAGREPTGRWIRRFQRVAIDRPVAACSSSRLPNDAAHGNAVPAGRPGHPAARPEGPVDRQGGQRAGRLRRLTRTRHGNVASRTGTARPSWRRSAVRRASSSAPSRNSHPQPASAGRGDAPDRNAWGGAGRCVRFGRRRDPSAWPGLLPIRTTTRHDPVPAARPYRSRPRVAKGILEGRRVWVRGHDPERSRSPGRKQA